MDELQALMKMSKDDEWLRAHYSKLQEEYENEYVAIENDDVIEHSKDMNTLITELKEKNKNPAMLLIKFVRKKGSHIIL